MKIILMLAILPLLHACDRTPEQAAQPAQPLVQEMLPAPDGLPAGVERMTPIVAAAELFVDSRLMTRFDSAGGVASLPCTDFAPERMLLAADGRVLSITGGGQSLNAVIELVSVGEVSANDEECSVEHATVDQRVRTDTVRLSMARERGGWEADQEQVIRGHDHLPLVGPLYQIRDVDWQTLSARVDSIRVARGKTPARPYRNSVGHYRNVSALDYPAYHATACPAPTQNASIDDIGEISYADPFAADLHGRHGPWYAIYEPHDAGGRGCITPVNVVAQQARALVCHDDPDKLPVSWYIRAESIEEKPQLFVRHIPNVRTGLQPQRFSVVSVPGWNDGAFVYNDTGEMLRVVETPAEAGKEANGFRLNAWYKGERHPLLWIDERPPQTWEVFWVGLLNNDDVPDFVIRHSRNIKLLTRHTLRLVISDTTDTDASPWRLSGETTVQHCETGSSEAD